MTYIPERHLQTGGDPRTLNDYATLRDELSKLTHPARPDINWLYIEKLCLSLFEQNGIELQTAAWYTLARTQLAGIRGMNEGLAIIEALITRQWGHVWPQAVHSRVDILASLARRLQQFMRTQVMGYDDLSVLYLVEKNLTSTLNALQRLELKHQTGLDVLWQQMHNATVRLENIGDGTDCALPPAALQTDPGTLFKPARDESPPRRVWIVQTPCEPGIRIISRDKKMWKPFIAGMFTMLITGGLLLSGVRYVVKHSDRQALMSSIAPFPSQLSESTLKTLRQTGEADSSEWFPKARQQIEELLIQSPVWSLNYGGHIITQAQTLWPGQPETIDLSRHWQKQLSATAASTESLEGWHQGIAQLRKLADRLNGLDEGKGKYLTVSELKSQIFSIDQSFNQYIPAEELLRQLATHPANKATPTALQMKTELQLRQLLARYALLVSHHEEGIASPH